MPTLSRAIEQIGTIDFSGMFHAPLGGRTWMEGCVNGDTVKDWCGA